VIDAVVLLVTGSGGNLDFRILRLRGGCVGL
jgi:hypothetical protein